MKVTLLSLDAVTRSMILYSLGIMQRPSATNSYYQVWAVLLVTLRYSVKIGRPAGIALKQTPLVDLMSSFWAANILRSQAMVILKAAVWLLWSVNSARIIHGFVSSEHANNSHRENMRLLTDYMRHEHRVGARGHRPHSTMAGYRYLVLGESKKQKQKEAEQVVRDEVEAARDEVEEVEAARDEVEATENIKRLLLALREDDKELITLDKIWNHHTLDEELKDLCLSFALYKLLRRRFFNFPIHEANLKKTRWLVLDGILGGNRNSERAFRVSEAEVAFLNDFFNSRHAIIFAEGFPFLRLLLSTLLIGGISGMAVAIHSFSKVAKQDEFGRVHHGVVFTWILLSLLGAKEIWEIITYVFSDWTKVLLLCKYVEQPWWLRGRVAKSAVRKLCRCPLFKRWHGKVGQLNLLFSTSIWRRPRAPFLVDLSREVKQAVIDSLNSLRNRRLDSYLERAEATDELRAKVNEAVNGLQDDVHILLVWHIATCYCELDSRRNVKESIWSRGRAFGCRNPSNEGADLWWSHYMTARTLSQYCAYVFTLAPPLLPGNSLMARAVFEEVYREKNRLLLRRHVSLGCCTSSEQILKRLEGYASGEIKFDGNEEGNTILKRGAELGKMLTAATSDDNEALWKFLSEFWAGFVLYLAASTKASQHKIFLSTGGELMTHLWALLSHAGYLGAAEHGHQSFDMASEPIPVYVPYVQY